MEAREIKALSDRIRENISKVIIGKNDIIDLILTAFYSGGHVLLDDIPGVGKTLISKCLARSINCDFKRIQFTPDLLPTDLTGMNYFNQKESEFLFRMGPVFSNIILADEINRATPRTQSSLLECMEEFQVTVDGETRPLERPFFVIATQNPIENQGTFPLPEAQLDRFLMRLRIGYPSKSDGRDILDAMQNGHTFNTIAPVSKKEEAIKAHLGILNIEIHSDVKDYIMEIVEKTRDNKNILLGISPRGSIHLMRAAQAYAAIHGRNHVLPDDVKKLIVPVLAHRIILRDVLAIATAEPVDKILNDIICKTRVPIEDG